MPYIKVGRERLLRDPFSACNAGELNFAVTTMMDRYLHDMGVSYQNINECIGVLECAKLELYRRLAAPYENAKQAANGDVYSNRVRTDAQFPLHKIITDPDVEVVHRLLDTKLKDLRLEDEHD